MRLKFKRAARWMCLVVSVTTGLGFASCGSDKTASADKSEKTEAATENEPLSPAEERALTGELQVQADERITEENASEEAAKLEKEIEADTN